MVVLTLLVRDDKTYDFSHHRIGETSVIRILREIADQIEQGCTINCSPENG